MRNLCLSMPMTQKVQIDQNNIENWFNLYYTLYSKRVKEEVI